jgi:hypothetical protein
MQGEIVLLGKGNQRRDLRVQSYEVGRMAPVEPVGENLKKAPHNL